LINNNLQGIENMLKVIDVITTVISILPRLLSVLKIAGVAFEKIADALKQFPKGK
jgi:hypothetical protein